MALFRPFSEDRRALPSSFHASLLQAIDCVMSAALCPQVVSQDPQHFKTSPPVSLLNLTLSLTTLDSSMSSGTSRGAVFDGGCPTLTYASLGFLSFSVALRPQRPCELFGTGSPGPVYLDFHTAPELWTSSVLLHVHRDRADYLGRGTQDGHLDFHTAHVDVMCGQTVAS